jgi:hypothetical protein
LGLNSESNPAASEDSSQDNDFVVIARRRTIEQAALDDSKKNPAPLDAGVVGAEGTQELRPSYLEIIEIVRMVNNAPLITFAISNAENCAMWFHFRLL